MRSLVEKIRAAYPESKRDWDRTYPVLFYIWRPLSFDLAAALMARGVTANQVTLATAVMGAGGLLGLGSPGLSDRMAGALAIVLYNLFDCVDGNIARACPPERPPIGKFFDQLVGHTYTLSYLAMGLGLRRGGDAWEALALGALATVSKYVFLHTRGIFWSVLGPYWGIHKDQTGFSGHAGTWYYRVYYNLCDMQGHAVLLPLVVAFGWTLWFLRVSAVLAAAEVLLFGGMYLRRAFKMRGIA